MPLKGPLDPFFDLFFMSEGAKRAGKESNPRRKTRDEDLTNHTKLTIEATMGVDEENLNARLVPPEDVDDPNRAFTKGEEQPKGCRDVWAALLFYAQAIAVGVFCFWLGVPALTKQIDSTDQQGNSNGGYNVQYEGIMYLVMAAAGCALVLSSASLAIMSCCPKILIQFSLLVSLAVSLAVCVYAFIYSSILGGVFGAIIFALSLCYGMFFSSERL